MTELLTAAQMRTIEAAAIASGTVTAGMLMERAGQGVVAAILAEWPELATGGAAPRPRGYLQTEESGRLRAVVLCGPGNNGGDGFVVARLLREVGWAVEVYLYGAAERLPTDARANYVRWVEIGQVRTFSEFEASGLGDAHVVIDALFGTGLTRDVEPSVMSFWETARKVGCRRVAVDIVSGVCADSGRIRVAQSGSPKPEPVDLTVTFHRQKCGHVLDGGAEVSGRVVVVPLGIEGFALSSAPVELVEMNAERLFSVLKGNNNTSTHKYGYGHALILSGPVGRGGACRLAARGALRIGAGLVTVGCMSDSVAEHAARLDAVMLKEINDSDDLHAILADKRINSVCLGPGLGLDQRGGELVETALNAAKGAGSGPALVLDADALTILARRPDLFALLGSGCVLTPHAGEFARLFPAISDKLDASLSDGPAYSKIDAVREAAKLAGCVILFKGPDTVIADPTGNCSVSSSREDRLAPWLATAGSGDVLAGFIAGLLARGSGPMQTAETGAWLHVECAVSFGPGLIAEDLPEQLPQVFHRLQDQAAAGKASCR
jgi:hydroxyethylthiazole kinase-like uncharacterized protein yjeF